MSPRVLAALLGVVGGLLLGVAGGLSFLSQEYADGHHALAVAGYAVTLAALVALGHLMVPRAPVWLRLIVMVAFPLLAASVWQVVDQAIDDKVDGWRSAAETHLLGGVIVLAVALVGFRQQAANREERYQPSHR
jgi:hypothetical protein